MTAPVNPFRDRLQNPFREAVREPFAVFEQPVSSGTPATDLARIDPIATAFRLGTLPEKVRDSAQAAINRDRAPSKTGAAVDVLLSHAISPLSDRLAEAGSNAALDRRAQAPGADLSRESTLYGVAGAAGDLLGAVGTGAGVGGALKAGRTAVKAVRLARGPAVRAIIRSAGTGAAVNAPFGFVGGLVGGDDHDRPGLKAGLRQAGHAAEYGAAGGALFGVAGEAIGQAMAAKAARSLERANTSTLGDRVLAGQPEGPASALGALEEAAAPEYRHSGTGLVPRALDALRTAYRSAIVTPYAEIEHEAPQLAAALETAGAATQRAQHIGSRRVGLVLEGLNPEQKEHFGRQLVLDNLNAEAERKGAQAAEMVGQAQTLTGAEREAVLSEAQGLSEAATRFRGHAEELASQVPGEVPHQPWFQQALAKHKAYVEGPLTEAATKAGVSEASLRHPTSAYLKLSSKAQLDDQAIRRAMELTGTTSLHDLGRQLQRNPLLKSVFGEDPELQALVSGPLSREGGGYPGIVNPTRRTAQAGSSHQAAGTAATYETDYARVVAADARDKIVKAARNDAYRALSASGRVLAPGEAPAIGKRVVGFDDRANVVTDAASATVRVEVTPRVANSFKRFTQAIEGKPRSAAGEAWHSFTSKLTQAQISGMPVEATSHANSLASIVASVPGEKDAVSKALLAVPGAGSKAAAMREMWHVDFGSPEIRALENRLADIGALRVQEPQSGLIHKASNWLFGPGGVDPRARLVLARRYLARKPSVSDDELREFITSKVGNYIEANSGGLTNALQNSGLSAFGRFQAARIPTSVRATFGHSGLPALSALQKAGDVANTLYRGPVGHLIGTNALNYALTGHTAFENEPGHKLDLATGLSAVPGGVKHLSQEEREGKAGDARQIYLPAATINPVVATGLRASGLRDFPPFSSREGAGHFADVGRDMVNVALGTLSPAMRALAVAATGRTPFLSPSGDFLRVTSSRFNRDHELGDRIQAAVKGANPAVSAYAGQGGDLAGRSLGEAIETDTRLGGLPSILAKTAEFLLPRIAVVGSGNSNSDLAATKQAEREYIDAMADYVRRVLGAHGEREEEEVIAEAKNDAASRGLNGELVEASLRKAVAGEGAKPAKAQKAAARFYGRNPEAVPNPFRETTPVTVNPFR